MLRFFKKWMLMMPAVVVMLTACINDDFPDEGTSANGGEAVGDVFIRFRLSLGESIGSRADGEGTALDSMTCGTANEQAISSVDILVCDENDCLLDIMYLSPEQIAKASSDDGAVVPLIGLNGKKLHIYATVNLTPAMRNKFGFGQSVTEVTFSSTETDSWNVINEFIPGSYGNSERLGDSGIPMTGQFVLEADGSADILIDGHNTSETALKVNADLKRAVAKVHLLAETRTFPVGPEGNKIDVTYVVAKDSPDAETQTEAQTQTEDYSGWLGWMRLDNVRYMINGTNKSSYLFPHTQANGTSTVNKDMNMSLAAYLNGGIFDETKWRKDFNFYDGMSLHSANISNGQYFGNAESYNGPRLDNTATSTYKGDNRYTKGLYCLENYFEIPADKDFYSGQKNAIPMVTHLSIATRLAPRYLLVLTDFPKLLDDFFQEAEDKHYSDEFYAEYGMTNKDFDESDTELWKSIRTVYFGEDYLNNKYDENEPNKQFGRSRIFRKDFYIFPAENETIALSFVNWSLIARRLWSSGDADFERGKYPKYTYFVYDTKKYDNIIGAAEGDYSQRYLYLVAGAVMNAKGENAGIKTFSVPHIGGWGYYYTYIDNYNGGGTTVDGVTSFEASQVTRNSYYLINVGNFGTPGGTVTDPEYIKVNTVPVGWDYTGKGEINLH